MNICAQPVTCVSYEAYVFGKQCIPFTKNISRYVFFRLFSFLLVLIDVVLVLIVLGTGKESLVSL